MASVLKSKSQTSQVGPSGLAGFNLDDFASNSRQLIVQAQQEAARVIAQAEIKATEIAEKAAVEGRAKGIAEGKKTIEDEITKRVAGEVQRRLQVLEKTSQQLTQQTSEWLEQYASTMTQTAIQVAEKVIMTRLESEPEVVVRWTEQALRHARSARSLVVAVHPETLVKLGEPLEALLRSAGVPDDTRLEPDESLEPFGVVVRQLGGSIDSQLSSQLESLARQLLPTTAKGEES